MLQIAARASHKAQEIQKAPHSVTGTKSGLPPFQRLVRGYAFLKPLSPKSGSGINGYGLAVCVLQYIFL